jgi:transcriptional regulator with XRE-family HTH domain
MNESQPPPEATLLRLVRKAAHVTLTDAACAAGISKSWLSYIESGHKPNGDPVTASDEDIARLCAHVGITPERLESEGHRPDGAAVLREIIARRRAEEGRASVHQLSPRKPPDEDGFTRPAYRDPAQEAEAARIEHDSPDLTHMDVHFLVTARWWAVRIKAAEAENARLLAENERLREQLKRARPRVTG